MKARYIIHAVGPRWAGGNHGESQLLYSAYRSSLERAVENGCASIAFPLISAGIFGYPVEQAWQRAIQACSDFLEEGNEIDIIFAVLDDAIIEIGKTALWEMKSNKSDDVTSFGVLSAYADVSSQHQEKKRVE